MRTIYRLIYEDLFLEKKYMYSRFGNEEVILDLGDQAPPSPTFQIPQLSP